MKIAAAKLIMGAALAIALGFGLFPLMEMSALCADCQSGNLPGIKRAFETFDENCKKQLAGGTPQRNACLSSNVYNKVLPIMKALSKDNRFGPGNRILLVGEAQDGNLPAGADRGFQSLAPLDKDSLTVELNKSDGGNGAIAVICSVDETGAAKRLGTIRFDENSETGKKTATVTGVQGKIVCVDIHSFGGAVKKFQYTLKTSQ